MFISLRILKKENTKPNQNKYMDSGFLKFIKILSHLVVLIAYSCLWMLGSNPDLLHARLGSFPLYYHSDPQRTWVLTAELTLPERVELGSKGKRNSHGLWWQEWIFVGWQVLKESSRAVNLQPSLIILLDLHEQTTSKIKFSEQNLEIFHLVLFRTDKRCHISFNKNLMCQLFCVDFIL